MKDISNRSLLVVLAVVSLIAAVALSACSGGGYGAPNTTTSKTTASQASGNSVTLAGFAFSPASITVKVGTTVTWTNKDSATHTVVSDSGVFQSGNLAVNATYTYTFSTAGSYAYHCSIHPSMKGTVIVQ
jgi:plastocyanin